MIRGQMAVRQSQSRKTYADATFQLAAAALAIVEGTGKIRAVNERFCSLLGLTRRKLLSTTLQRLTASMDPTGRDDLIHHFTAGKAFSVERLCGRAETESFFLRLSASPLPRRKRRQPDEFLVTAEDLTAQRNLEVELRQVRAELLKTEELGGVGHWTWDPATDAVTWTEPIARFAGWDPKSPAPSFREHARFFTPESWKQLTEDVDRAYRFGTPYCRELPAIRADGSAAWVLARGEAQRNGDGSIIALRGTIQDISERKQEEQMLRESERKFAQAFRCSPQPFTLSTIAEDRYLDVNDAFEATTGYAREEAIGRTTEELNIWENPPEREKLVQRALSGERIRNIECRFRKKNGEIFIGLLSAELMGEIGGEPCVVANTIDITEWRRTEEALHAAEKRAALYLRQTMFAVIELDRNFHIVEWNPAAEKIFGFTRDEALDRHPDELIVPSGMRSIVDQVLQNLLRQSGGQLSVNENMRKDGARIICEWFNTPLVGSDGQVMGIVAMAHDITARQNAERELTQLSGRLITAQEEERARIARELHDALGQELALVTVELSGAMETASADVCNQLHQVSQKVKTIASEVSELSHRLHPSSLRFLGISAALTSFCREISNAHAIDVEFRSKNVSRLPGEMELCLYRITQEALRNVVKHSQAKHVSVRLNGDSQEVALEISDDGIGFDTDRASAGLGLVSMRERLRPLGGQIKVRSKPNEGTQIEVHVPLKVG